MSLSNATVRWWPSAWKRTRPLASSLIKHGNEIGIPAVPYSVGTTTHIDSIENLADGTLAVMTSGVRRFVLEEVIQERPFQIGRVTYPEDTADPLSDTDFAEMREIAARCVQRWLALNRQWMREPPLPRSQRGLSFSIAMRLPLEMDVKQMLLECPSASERSGKRTNTPHPRRGASQPAYSGAGLAPDGQNELVAAAAHYFNPCVVQRARQWHARLLHPY